jgi:murein DD-endopeptidase MepM/ murein hydrolase activator NlpD
MSSSSFASDIIVSLGRRPSPKRVAVSFPAAGVLSSSYGFRGSHFHKGIDIAAPAGSKILAAHSGVVTFAGFKQGYGLLIEIGHSDFKTRYAHCQRLLVKAGQHVEKAELIALVGQTGNARGAHLHFEVRGANGRAIDPSLFFIPTSQPGAL